MKDGALERQALALTNIEPYEFDGEPISYHHNTAYDAANDRFGDRLLLDSIHDGDGYPAFLADMFAQPDVRAAYEIEKDWAANHIANSFAQKMNVPGFYRVNIARALLDFGRFPGSTNAGNRQHLDRLAINPPFTERLDYNQKKRVLNYYDEISSVFDKALRNKILKISIHTYDKFNPGPIESERTMRPMTSVIYRSSAYQATSRMPFGLFDRLYIDELGEFTADRTLIARICLTLEKARISVGQNHPYTLPEGSVEVRAQVWMFFQFLRRQYEELYPETREDTAFQAVWRMLSDTNLRDGDSEIYRSYIHMYRRAPAGYEGRCEAVKNAYLKLKEFVNKWRYDLYETYRWHPRRFNSIVFEVRKDVAWDFATMTPREEQIEQITTLLAHAVETYFAEDLDPSLDDLGLY
ncbi:MAG TPA: hypothetical protein VLL52_09240 [Anaerolineae bacterium]|nr:hypothetical protein [Anaerolineae bacterium]